MDYTIESLDSEFSEIMIYFTDHHESQRNYVDYYNHSAVYQRTGGDAKSKRDNISNLLKAFADKNVNYTCKFPGIKVQSTSTDPQEREAARKREKILYGTWQANNGEMLQKEWSWDGTIQSEAIARTVFDVKNRKVEIKHFDPRYVYYQYSNDIDKKLIAVWIAYPVTADEIEAKYGIRPEKSDLTSAGVTPDGNPIPVDSRERFWFIERWDDKVKAVWCGDKFIERPHKHLQGGIPFDKCNPFPSGGRFGNFFLAPLVSPQAEYNETLRRKANIVRRMGNPAIWGRGIIGNQADEVKKALQGEGGFISLKQQGELGFLQLNETKIFDEHMDRLFADMKNLAGFPTATFGEIAGANTSGDALSMYFQPTTQSAEAQWICWKEFYQAINAKILRLYEKFGKAGDTFTLSGYAPKGTFEKITETDEEGNETSRLSYIPRSFSVTFTADDIAGNYSSTIITPSVTPKDEVAYKTLIMNAANQGFLPLIEAFEEWGAVDPQDLVDLLEQQNQNPAFNSQGVKNVADALAAGQQGATPNEQTV